MDSDDISLPQRLETQVGFMETNPGISICGTSVEIFTQEKTKILTFPCHNETIKYSMLFYCCFAHPTLMFKRFFFEAHAYKEGRMEDYLLWLSLIPDTSITFANIGSVLLRLRKHPGNASKNTKAEEEVNTKRQLLNQMFGVEIGPEVVGEFIQVTGRALKT